MDASQILFNMPSHYNHVSRCTLSFRKKSLSCNFVELLYTSIANILVTLLKQIH